MSHISTSATQEPCGDGGGINSEGRLLISNRHFWVSDAELMVSWQWTNLKRLSLDLWSTLPSAYAKAETMNFPQHLL